MKSPVREICKSGSVRGVSSNRHLYRDYEIPYNKNTGSEPMKPLFENGNVKSQCPECNSITTFEFKESNNEFGNVIINKPVRFEGKTYSRTIFKLMRCASCGRAGLAKIFCNNSFIEGELVTFYPTSFAKLRLPESTPYGLLSEFREAEECAANGTYRAASALFRSTLEKTLKLNGYTKRNLIENINVAASDGVITVARQKKANDDVRVLGNNVLHDEWREVLADEVVESHFYTQRIIEDFYDDRQTVEEILKTKGRI